jgi:PIN domain nuclease of toxin-antitoxin system
LGGSLVIGPYLLDTSTLIWSMASPDRLSPLARRALKTGPLVLSVVSYWEVVIKARKGMLAVADPVSWWSRATIFLGGDILSIRAAHISAMAGLPDLHKDPFDRMLVAQAVTEGLVFLSSDDQIRRYSLKTLW